MATINHAIRENDVVELRHPAGRWPAGTSGTVVSERGDAMLVEISDEQGQMLDLVSQAESQLKLIARYGD